jgi:hypothetical protein
MMTNDDFFVMADCGVDVIPLAEAYLRHWAYDLHARKPGPALLVDGVLQPTDLDLACFLSALADRGAVINIPEYHAARPTTLSSDEHVVSKENRHGKVIGLTSNREVFSFSVIVEDANVVKLGDERRPDVVGAPRAFMLTDLDGSWRNDGWKTIEFHPTAKENAFLEKNQLWTAEQLVFTNWVHPNRWVSFYGRPYFCTKALVARLSSEATWRRAEQKRLLSRGVKFPVLKGRLESGRGGADRQEEPGAPRIVTAFEAEVEAPALSKTFPWKGLPLTQAALVKNAEKEHRIQHELLPKLRLATRLTELAFWQHVRPDHGYLEGTGHSFPRPAWVSERWRKVVPGGNRKEWFRIDLPHVMAGAALQWRIYPKKEVVKET